MRFFPAFIVVSVALGICFTFELDGALDTFDQLVDDTARQSRDDLDTLIPVFGIAFTASLLNNLVFGNLANPLPAIGLPTPAPPTTTSTTASTTTSSSTSSTTASTTTSSSTTASTSSSTTASTTTVSSVSTTPGIMPVPTQAQYCAISADHTMCKYAGPSATCTAKTNLNMITEEQKQSIVDKHNELRRRVAKGQEPGQPAASNMKEMVWNEEIAIIAQRFADQCMDICPGGASICHEENLLPSLTGMEKLRNKLDGTSVGQNIAWFSGKQVSEVPNDLTQSVQTWYDEVDGTADGAAASCQGVKFDPSNINPFPLPAPACHGHYTQLAWADSEEVGCGVIHFGTNPPETVVICNYAPAGNLGSANGIVSVMYEQGTAGSACPSGYANNDGLCSKNNRRRKVNRKKNKKNNKRKNKNKKYQG